MIKSYRQDELDRLTLPVMEWLRENFHPHMKIIIDGEHAEMLEGLQTSQFDEDKLYNIKP